MSGTAGSEQAAKGGPIASASRNPTLLQVGLALVENDLPAAEAILRPYLKRRPMDVAAIRMMAELAARVGRLADAENLLRRAIELAPGFTAARSNLATVLYKQNRPLEAVRELDQISLWDAGAEIGNASLKAAAMGRIGRLGEARELYRRVLDARPNEPMVWMSYGHILKTVGEQGCAVEAYRKALELRPGLGEAWWSLANLKTVSFSGADISAMRDGLERRDLRDEDRFHLHFALGKALEDAGETEDSFAHYNDGNRLRAELVRYDPKDTRSHVDRSVALYTPEFFAERKGWGASYHDPIFIIGLPRAGSTLIEQILSCHSAVEGTAELPDLPDIAGRLKSGYPNSVAQLTADDCAALGAEYLERASVQRFTDKPFFIDKLPNNWLRVGLIRLILPNARIIDARRHPLACGFSNFKQHFARGQSWSYDLGMIGAYYRDYLTLMRHFDAVLPRFVHRVIHDRLVEDPESEVRRILEALDLPYEESCLQFHKNKRAVRTASSEQVRQPISTQGLDQWRRFEPWLDPLKAALGPAVDDWADAAKP